MAVEGVKLKFRSLRQKMIIRSTAILLTTMVIILLIFVTFSYKESQRQINKIIESQTKFLQEKGSAMVRDKHLTLATTVQDLSVSNMIQVVKENFLPETGGGQLQAFGGFVESDFRLWAWVTPEGKFENQSDMPYKQDEITTWALSLNKLDYKKQRKNGQDYYVFATPIFIRNEDEFETEDGAAERSKAGAFVYALSTAEMDEAVKAEQASYLDGLKTWLFISGLLVLGVLVLGIILTQRQAATITRPLAVLTSAADTIASGNYSIEVDISSGDEIQELASSFNQMVKDLDTTYAELHSKNKELEEQRKDLEKLNEDLEKLNKHLDEKVEDRTRKLAESESKFRTLFEKSADAILLGNEQEFFDCNPAMLKMMGCETKEELLLLSPYEVSPETQPDGSDSAEKLHEYYRGALEKGSEHFEWVNKRVDGSEFNTEIVITSFPLGEKHVLHKVFRDITERKQTEDALRDAQLKLVETAHSAGMAEIATGVLHNIGNILNSVNISTEEISLTLKNSKLRGFLKANEMVKKNMDRLSAFFNEDPKGKLIPGYYISLGDAIFDEHDLMLEEIKALTTKVSMMRDVISTQQNYAKASLYTEDVVITDIIEDAIKLQVASLNKQGVKIKREYIHSPTGMVPKVKLVHVLTNLIKNGKEAMSQNAKEHKTQDMVIRMEQIEENTSEIRIYDNGCGIKKENLDKIFNHGFTTKEHGHGFGLHTCANFMTEMGGSLLAESDGEGKGSVFIVRFPLVCENRQEVLLSQ